MQSNLSKIEFDRLILPGAESESAHNVLKFWNSIRIPENRFLLN